MAILGPNGKPWRREADPESRYDAAETTDHNREHWKSADGLSARSANSLEVRKRLRERMRAECGENNSYGRGIVETLANDLVGTGPRLQLKIGDPLLQAELEERLTALRVARELHDAEVKFGQWLAAIGAAEKLRLAKKAKVTDGEIFGVLHTNERLRTPVKLDCEMVECDRITDPWMQPSWMDPRQNDGIKYDGNGNAVQYFLRNGHPGDAWNLDFGGRWIDAKYVLHWFRRDRCGQLRGVPELTTALPLFAQLRRWTLATLTAAEAAADIAGLLKSTLGPDGGEVVKPKDWEKVRYARGMLMCLPEGYELDQLDAKHPNQRYQEFKRELLCEMVRCVSMPYAIAAGDSSDSSYAGGRLEFQSWAMVNRVEQSHLDAAIVCRLFDVWMEEAVLVPGFLAKWITPASVAASFFYDTRPHVDPSKEATANETNLRNHATTYARWYAKEGLDWEEELRQRGRELGLMNELGLKVEAAPAAGGAGSGGGAQEAKKKKQVDDGAADEPEEINGNGKARRAYASTLAN